MEQRSKPTIKRMLKRMANQIRGMLNEFRRFANGLGSKKKCYICGKTFDHFTKYRKGSKGLNEFRKRLTS
jgi:hypothetical protein